MVIRSFRVCVVLWRSLITARVNASDEEVMKSGEMKWEVLVRIRDARLLKRIK